MHVTYVSRRDWCLRRTLSSLNRSVFIDRCFPPWKDVLKRRPVTYIHCPRWRARCAPIATLSQGLRRRQRRVVFRTYRRPTRDRFHDNNDNLYFCSSSRTWYYIKNIVWNNIIILYYIFLRSHKIAADDGTTTRHDV